MSDAKLLVLQTTLYMNPDKTALHDCLAEVDQSSTIVVGPTTMQVADWDQVIQKILDHDQCLTL